MAIKKINKKKVSSQKKGKKKWHPIHAPALFGEALLGESYVYNVEDIEGKYLTANLSIINRNMRRQNANVKFKVVKLVDGKGVTEIVGYSMINASVKRLVRRGRDKVADSFLAKTKDKKVIRIKPLIITANHTTKLIQSSCRLEARKLVREFVFTKDVEQTIEAIVSGKLQKIIKEGIKKIFKIRSVDIRIAKLEENTKLIVTENAIKSEEVKVRKVTKAKDDEKWTHESEKTQAKTLDFMEEKPVEVPKEEVEAVEEETGEEISEADVEETEEESDDVAEEETKTEEVKTEEVTEKAE